ncbi:protein PRD1 isoform X2 [Morus notabilis]|uniref:protein PRD1 isoform X2 n=1 Tax=Morus notabilis TaxID=981085 RepID=UPI000CED64B2|nr:protein PRD1 isoform X2 [Morus notabilis]
MESPSVQLHCLGILLKCQKDNPYAHIKDKYGLVSNLVGGLQLPNDEIRGEILFVLYKLSLRPYASRDDGGDILPAFCSKLLYLSMEALVKTQSDDVRLNCVALLTVLAQRGFFGNAYSVGTMGNSTYSYEADSVMQATQDGIDGSSLNILFAEAIKGPLLSTDSQVQISTVNLLFYYLTWEGISSKEIQVLVEENIVDYVFEILRLSECKDPVVNSCLQVLDLLSIAKQAFKQRLVVGFATLIPVLQYVAEIPFHPVQSQTLKLISICVSDYPGIPSASQIKQILIVLTRMLEKHAKGEMDMLPETFVMACSIFVSLLKSPSSHGTSSVELSIKEASQHAVLSCLSVSEKNSCQLLHSLYLLKEVYAYTHEENSEDSGSGDLRNVVKDICAIHLLPWFITSFREIEEETVEGVLETFHSILLWDSDIQATQFAENVVSSSWFSLSFGCLGLFPTEKMKQKVYLILSSLVDVVLGNHSGQSIRDAALRLPLDPIDMLFLLGQKSSYNLELSYSQSAILTILYTSSLYDERLADDKLVLASLEEYIIVNGNDFRQTTDSFSIMRLLYLYGVYRGLAKVSYQFPYSPEAESILFQLAKGNEWDLVSARIHPISLKWLFQQEKFNEPLSDQILKFCRSNISYISDITSPEKNRCAINVQAIAELVASGDNYAARLLVCLWTELVKEEVQESDAISLLNLLTTIVNISPAASDALCWNSIGNAIHAFCKEGMHTLSLQTSTPLLVLILNLLSSAHPEALSDDEIWLAVIMKLVEYFIPTESAGRWNHDNLLVIGILSLALNHSTTKVLMEASKSILFNSSLVSVIDNMIHEACLKGPALADHDEGTSYGQRLVFVLLLNYFSLKSLRAVLPGIMDWQSFFDPPDRTQPLSMIGISCHGLCRLMCFGSPLVKLVASHCLLELFAEIAHQRNTECEELKSTVQYLISVISVLEGFVFYSDQRVAVNCSLCLSMIFGREMLDSEDASMIGKNSWSRLIVEELAVSLSVQSLASKSFINQHNPAIYVALALLKLENIPSWMRIVFDDPCISGIIENLTASNVTSEIVALFRELLNCGFLKKEQIACLHHVFKACRKRLYTDNAISDSQDEHTKKAVTMSGDLGEIREYLIFLMSSKSSQDSHFAELHRGNKSLLKEIELFLSTSTVEDESHEQRVT